jgi:hypothetical protein
MMQAAGNQPVEDSVARVNEEVAVGEDLTFQRSWWRFERIVWIFFLLIIALDLAGAFGRGPSIMSIQFDSGAVRAGYATLFVSDKLVSALGAQRIIPQPATTRLGSGGLTYSFPVTTTPSVVRIELEPSGPGRFPVEISAGSQAASVKTVVWVMP